MSYIKEPEDNFAQLSDIPFATLVKLSLALAIGGAVFFFLFGLLAWISGLPGPFLWFGGENRFLDIIGAALGTAFAIFMSSVFGAIVVKFTARWHPFNFRFRIR